MSLESTYDVTFAVRNRHELSNFDTRDKYIYSADVDQFPQILRYNRAYVTQAFDAQTYDAYFNDKPNAFRFRNVEPQAIAKNMPIWKPKMDESVTEPMMFANIDGLSFQSLTHFATFHCMPGITQHEVVSTEFEGQRHQALIALHAKTPLHRIPAIEPEQWQPGELLFLDCPRNPGELAEVREYNARVTTGASTRYGSDGYVSLFARSMKNIRRIPDQPTQEDIFNAARLFNVAFSATGELDMDFNGQVRQWVNFTNMVHNPLL